MKELELLAEMKAQEAEIRLLREMVQSLRTPVHVVPPALPPLPPQQVIGPAEMAELVRASHPPVPALHTLQELAKILRG